MEERTRIMSTEEVEGLIFQDTKQKDDKDEKEAAIASIKKNAEGFLKFIEASGNKDILALAMANNKLIEAIDIINNKGMDKVVFSLCALSTILITRPEDVDMLNAIFSEILSQQS